MSIRKRFISVERVALVTAGLMLSSCCCDPAPDPCLNDRVDSLQIGSLPLAGLDSALRAPSVLFGQRPTVTSLLIARNGVLAVQEGNLTDSMYMASVTKSVIAMLVGISLKEKTIRDIDDPIREYLPDYFANVTDPLKKKITIRHLLTMQHGQQWNESADRLYGNYVQWAVDLPMDTVPGKQFVYSSAAYHLLSAIVTLANGKSTFALAKEKIFTPLGISSANWLADPQGFSLGGVGLYLKPADMAKIALTINQCGQYNGVSVVPDFWVHAMTSDQVSASFPYNGFYGFGWWKKQILGHDVAVARGFGGQTLYSIPDVALVMTTTGTSEAVHAAADSFLEYSVFPAIPSTLEKEDHEQ